VRKFGGSLLARPSERVEPGIGSSPSWPIRKPWTVPVPPAFRTYAIPSWMPTLFGNCPPDGTTFNNVSVSPWTRNAETVSLPAFTAISVW
jgi:hypothetical protein